MHRAWTRAALLLALSAGPASAEIRVSDGWVRAAPPGVPTSAVYLTLSNPGPRPDRLLGGSTPAAARLGLHGMTTTDGVMRMRDLASGLPLPPGGSVALKPGGDHLMLTGLKRPLKPGERVSLTLSLQTGLLRTTLPVLDKPPER